ncbi:hypothetical protein CHH28_11055 [Bacterioplanes sanyensis]|uniref:N-acetyltransferase domain-containing protein n=1 Tax=Bacterioplanes sanyensis TaxID=1249553 RepID=A0A222FKJ1_9GAMM|nr:GNAT family N-acetyltransferase [Bacterioplanes sanyensis]ASP39182.1 hypothetical protein CHH28_11055 [Bacterioplanes sanyensis]
MCQFEFRPDSPLRDCNVLYKAAADHNRASPFEQHPGLYVGNTLVAVCRLHSSGQHWWLRGLCVAPSWRGQKLGQQLLRQISEHWPDYYIYLRPLPGLERYYSQLGFQPLTDQYAFRCLFPQQKHVSSVMFRAADSTYTAGF